MSQVLRGILIAFGAALALAGGAMLMAGFPGGLACLIGGTVIVIGTLFEQIVYKHAASSAPGPGWVRTAERFVDPTTGKTLTVYEQPGTGERTYVED